MVAKFADHLPLYRQEKIFGRAGLAIARSTLAQWVGQTGVRLQPLVDARGLPGGTLHFPELDQARLEKCAKDNELIDSDIKLDIDIARSKGITATPTLVIRDNQTGRSVKLEGMADETTLLSAIDWLAKDL